MADNVWELHAALPHLDQQFETVPAAWTNHEWTTGLGYIMAAEAYTPPTASLYQRTLMGVGI